MLVLHLLPSREAARAAGYTNIHGRHQTNERIRAALPDGSLDRLSGRYDVIIVDSGCAFSEQRRKLFQALLMGPATTWIEG